MSDTQTRKRDQSRQTRERAGRAAELIAGAFLMLKGYRIVAWRHRSRFGEIDLIAVRAGRIAFIEVKARRTLAEAMAALGDSQARRIWDAAEDWVRRHPRHHGRTWGFDVVVVMPGRLPRHLPNALQPLY